VIRRAAAGAPFRFRYEVAGEPAPAAALLAALAAAALLADRVASVAAIAAVLFVVCLFGPRGRRKLFLAGALLSGSPFSL
jgi:hypothetical protein